jgi:hypothetical protein
MTRKMAGLRFLRKENVMKKILLSVGMLALAMSPVVQSAIITTDLTADTYITNNGLDWTWASPVTSATWSSSTLEAPDFHAGWRYATQAELSFLDTILDLFYTPQGEAIQSVQYWNTSFTHTDARDWNQGKITSSAAAAALSSSYDETVYVRGSDVSAVPIPAAAFMFAPALLGFIGLRRKAKNSVA